MSSGIENRWAAVVVAGGSGSRFGGPKHVQLLDHRPVMVHALGNLSALEPAVRILVLAPDFLESELWRNVQRDFPETVRWEAVPGGAERALSVLAGVRAARAAGADIVAVHDGARPFPPREATLEALHALRKEPALAAAIVSSEVTDTIKRVGGDGSTILSTEDRDDLRRAETPQVCRIGPLIEALSQPGASRFRDEGEALEAAGHSVRCILHREINLKITRPLDLILARAIASERKTS